MKRIDNQEFIEKVTKIHKGKYDYSKTFYTGNRNKVTIICPKHGEFTQTAKNHLSGQGCPECAKEMAGECRRKSQEEFESQIREKYGDKFDLSEAVYVRSNQKIRVTCRKCGKTFDIRPNDLLTNGHICNEDRSIRRYTGQEIIDEASKIHKGKYTYYVSPDELLLKKDTIRIVCPEHGVFEQKICDHLQGKGCPECGMEKFREARKISIVEMEKRIEKAAAGRFIFSMAGYENAYSQISFECKECGHKFYRKASSFLQNPSCPMCVKKMTMDSKRKTTEEFIEESKKIYGPDAFDYSKTEYISSSEKVTLICNECGREFQIEANSHLQGHGCPYHYCNRSRMEDELYLWFKENIDENAISNYRIPGKGIEIDIFSEKYSFGIEFDGLYWHNELNKDKNYHLMKLNECKSSGIRLFHVFEDEWIYKKDIVESMISTICGCNNRRIYARKCDVVEVSPHEAMEFLNENHLQGGCGSSIRYGLLYDGKLVSVMTFGKSRHFVGSGKNEYELLRFASIKGVSVIGGASRLFKRFIKDNDPENVVSYADKRWSVGNVYNKLGFFKYNESKPSYYYVKDNRRIYRFNMRKDVLIKKYGCPTDMTEREFCRNMKWWRIYDCGCLCFIWKKEK